MSMTKKQARAYVEDENNWSATFNCKPLRVCLLSFRGKNFFRFETWHYSNVRSEFMNLDDHYWMTEKIQEINLNKMELIGERLSKSRLADLIWEMDRS